MNFIQCFIYLIQITNEIHPWKNDIHLYEIIHACMWIKITLKFKFQAQSFKFKFHAHAPFLCLFKNNTNCTFNITFNTYDYVVSTNSKSFINYIHTFFIIIVNVPLFPIFWIILNKHNLWLKFNYSFKKHNSSRVYSLFPYKFSIVFFIHNWTYQTSIM
jgi:hypothetical protein